MPHPVPLAPPPTLINQIPQPPIVNGTDYYNGSGYVAPAPPPMYIVGPPQPPPPPHVIQGVGPVPPGPAPPPPGPMPTYAPPPPMVGPEKPPPYLTEPPVYTNEQPPPVPLIHVNEVRCYSKCISGLLIHFFSCPLNLYH